MSHKSRTTNHDPRITNYELRITIHDPRTTNKENKPNLLDAQMNVTSVKTMNYEQITMNNANKKQTQSNPICSELACGACPEPAEGSEVEPSNLFPKSQNEIKLLFNKGL